MEGSCEKRPDAGRRSHHPSTARSPARCWNSGWAFAGSSTSRHRARERTPAGIRLHSAATLTADDVIVIENIPCTTLARTLLDIAEAGTRREVERALDRAEQQQILDMRAIDDVLARASGRRGAKLLRAVLADHRAGCTLTHTELEEVFLAICRASELSPDAVNAWIPFPTAAEPRPTSCGASSTSSSRSTAAMFTRRGAPSDQTAGAINGSCCSAGASCDSRGSRSCSSRPTSPRRCRDCFDATRRVAETTSSRRAGLAVLPSGEVVGAVARETAIDESESSASSSGVSVCGVNSKVPPPRMRSRSAAVRCSITAGWLCTGMSWKATLSSPVLTAPNDSAVPLGPRRRV